ncbi:MAG: zinc ribbon domain-containing protein [Opitutales bacterium]|nr:zinc ribbon domain-containing protein [Opitutales bacterium]
MEHPDKGMLMKCEICEQNIQKDWAACPWCGAEIVRKPSCNGCGQVLEPAWKACPFCGEANTPADNGSNRMSIADSVIKGDVAIRDQRDFSRHTTNIRNETTSHVGQQFVGSTVNIHHGPDLVKEAENAFRVGKAALINGDYEVARQNLLKALQNQPDPEARAYLCVAKLAGRPLSSIGMKEMDEHHAQLNSILQSAAESSVAAHLARLVLGILLREFYDAKGCTVRGTPSAEIYRQLESHSPTPEERRIVSHLSTQRMTRILFNLD